jgi:hypothetical protein
VFDAPRRVEGAFGRIARDAVDLLGGEERPMIKVCARLGCGALFVDRTRTRSRRWCSMATCGNRVKVATYRGEGRYPFRVQVSPSALHRVPPLDPAHIGAVQSRGGSERLLGESSLGPKLADPTAEDDERIGRHARTMDNR